MVKKDVDTLNDDDVAINIIVFFYQFPNNDAKLTSMDFKSILTHNEDFA